MPTRRSEKPRTSFIDPDRLYTLEGFKDATGISNTRMREARLRGMAPEVLRVGRRVFIRGRDAIEYIERLAAESRSTDQTSVRPLSHHSRAES
jgi:hypothetical protein